MKKMLKRADGSYSQRGLWDNIRANKGSGKKPTKEMLKQEKKIKSSKKETGGPKSERVQNRANKVTAKSAENKQKALQVMSQGPLSTESVSGRSPAEQAKYKYERLMNKSSRQEGRAAKLQERADFLKAYGKKTGGKSSWLEEDSKEVKFGSPKKPKAKKYQTSPPLPEGKMSFIQDLEKKQAEEAAPQSAPYSPSRFTIGKTNFAISGKDSGPSGPKCISGTCKDVVAREGQAPSKQYESGVGKFNATKRLHGDKTIKLTKAQQAEQQAKADEARAASKAKQEERKARSAANNAEALMELKRLRGEAPEETTMTGIKKTGGKKTNNMKSMYKKGGAVPECGPGKFWDGSKCVDSKTNKLPETSWPDDLVNELIPTYDKKTGKREYAYSEGIFDAKGRARTVDYDEVKKQDRERKKKTGGKSSKVRESWMEEEKEIHFGKKPKSMKKSGGKSMKPGGGGRFAAMVSGLKKEGKSEDSAKAIAASIGRAKYGKSKFQAMAAAGKSKKQMGGVEDEDTRSARVGARAEKVMNKAKSNWQKAEAVVKFDKTKEFQNMAGDRFGRIATDKANQLYDKAARQENRAKRLKEKSEFLKASGKKMGGKRC